MDSNPLYGYLNCYTSPNSLSPSPSVEYDISGKRKAVNISLFNTPEPDELEPNSGSEFTKRKELVPEEEILKKDNCKKKRLSFRDYQARDLNPAYISEHLRVLQNSAYQCCSMACYLWLTLTIVLGCRAQYVGLESYQQRSEWLGQKFSEMERKKTSQLPHSQTIRYDYAINVCGYEDKKVCLKAFDFAYGIPPTTHKYASNKRATMRGCNKPRLSARKFAKEARRKGLSPKESYFAAWLKQYAQRAGDLLPMADQPTKTEVRLPQSKKKMVYECFLKFMEKDVTRLSDPLSYEEAVCSWKSRQDLSYIKCAKYKAGFSKCEVCFAHEEESQAIL
jgi:hypothetical protein